MQMQAGKLYANNEMFMVETGNPGTFGRRCGKPHCWDEQTINRSTCTRLPLPEEGPENPTYVSFGYGKI